MSEARYEDKYYRILERRPGQRYIAAAGSTVCVPLTDSGMVIFIIEPSTAFDQDVLLLPGGIIEQDESIEAAANRELQEEIGYRAERLNHLGVLHPWEKYLRTTVDIYLARDLVASKLHGDEIYEIKTELAPLNNFERLIQSGRLHDSSIIAALYMARQFLVEEAANPD